MRVPGEDGHSAHLNIHIASSFRFWFMWVAVIGPPISLISGRAGVALSSKNPLAETKGLGAGAPQEAEVRFSARG